MSRYIDADALLADLDKFAEDKQWRSKRTLRERWLRKQGIEIFRMGVKAFQAADVVEVVRCMDCKYYEQAKVNNKGFLICPASGMEITEAYFCSYGERRSE